MAQVGAVKFPGLRHVVFSIPAIDNHAHPLLKETHRDEAPFEGLISEAWDKALHRGAVHTIACFRASKELAALYGLPKNASWDDIKRHRSSIPYEELCAISFQASNIACLLLDDGLGGVAELAEDHKWHRRLVEGPAMRISRVETLAEDIIKALFESRRDAPVGELFESFKQDFTAMLEAESEHPDVVAFKSAICYRTGLAIEPTIVHTDLLRAFESLLTDYVSSGTLRLQNKPLNDWVVIKAVGVAAQANIPVQFHTGLGDNDLRLNLSSPSLMQPLIHGNPKTNFVILHASYPFTREAGYLTSVYDNVYLDIGEIFPMVSRRGQEATIREVLELCPTNKIVWSSDGHWWPESFYLGIYQARSALFKVLAELVGDGDLSEDQAMKIAEKALFHNANELYKLNLSL